MYRHVLRHKETKRRKDKVEVVYRVREGHPALSLESSDQVEGSKELLSACSGQALTLSACIQLSWLLLRDGTTTMM